MGNEITIAIIAGLVGGVISPVIYSEYQIRRRERTWSRPRKELLDKLLSNPKWTRRSLKWLTTVTGTTEDECRTLLIEMDARGTVMEDGSEGWALIERLPLGKFDDKDDVKE